MVGARKEEPDFCAESFGLVGLEGGRAAWQTDRVGS